LNIEVYATSSRKRGRIGKIEKSRNLEINEESSRKPGAIGAN
jgi:hypothetical protein